MTFISLSSNFSVRLNRPADNTRNQHRAGRGGRPLLQIVRSTAYKKRRRVVNHINKINPD
jgi:hypothetical protein